MLAYGAWCNCCLRLEAANPWCSLAFHRAAEPSAVCPECALVIWSLRNLPAIFHAGALAAASDQSSAAFHAMQQHPAHHHACLIDASLRAGCPAHQSQQRHLARHPRSQPGHAAAASRHKCTASGGGGVAQVELLHASLHERTHTLSRK